MWNVPPLHLPSSFFFPLVCLEMKKHLYSIEEKIMRVIHHFPLQHHVAWLFYEVVRSKTSLIQPDTVSEHFPNSKVMGYMSLCISISTTMGYFLNRTVIVRTEEMQQAAVFCSCTSRDNKSSKRARKYREKDCVCYQKEGEEAAQMLLLVILESILKRGSYQRTQRTKLILGSRLHQMQKLCSALLLFSAGSNSHLRQS